MGVLDEAIRDHLDLRRRHGASEAELARAEAEALGPARRDPAASIFSDEDSPHTDETTILDPVVEEDAGRTAEDRFPPASSGIDHDSETVVYDLEHDFKGHVGEPGELREGGTAEAETPFHEPPGEERGGEDETPLHEPPGEDERGADEETPFHEPPVEDEPPVDDRPPVEEPPVDEAPGEDPAGAEPPQLDEPRGHEHL
ncbi:MAG: hypothetical protein JOZ25_00825 [Actinobacteria bacterium]|nr:hypothetical protein [Actinomycetota bacterium]